MKTIQKKKKSFSDFILDHHATQHRPQNFLFFNSADRTFEINIK